MANMVHVIEDIVQKKYPLLHRFFREPDELRHELLTNFWDVELPTEVETELVCLLLRMLNTLCQRRRREAQR